MKKKSIHSVTNVFAVQANDLTVQYRNSRNTALQNVTVEVPQGTFTMLIGPNGSGKSTFLKTILGLLPYSGSLKVLGNDLAEKKSKSDLNIGWVPQRPNFDITFPITVDELLKLAQVQSKSSNRARDTDILREARQNVLTEVGAVQFAKAQLQTLSGGQLQRALLARALVNSPTLLILDEPETGIDVGGEQKFYDLIRHLVDSHGITVLVASHELDVVTTYADQVLCFNQKLLCAGAPAHVLKSNNLHELYGHTLAHYHHHA